jgi:hypothetical protein
MGPKVLAVVAMLGACKCSEPASSTSRPGTVETPETTGERAPVKRGPPLAETEFFRIDADLPACKSSETCEARLVLSALGDYKVNDEYPFKFVGDQGDLVIDGTGTFALDGRQTGTMTVKFRAPKPGTAKLSGTFKLSVCNDANCKIESPKIALDVPST